MVTGRFVALAAVGVALAFVSPLALELWVAALLVAGVVDALLAAPLRQVRANRVPGSPVRVGQDAAATVVLRNESARLARLAVRDQWLPSAGASPAVTTLRSPGGASQQLNTLLRPTRRGTRKAVRLTVRSSGPLGLVARQRTRPLPGALLVLPEFPARRLLPTMLARVRELEGSIVARRAGPGTEFDSLRSYVPGDEASSIDWRATARSTSVIVRTFRPEQNRRVLLVLDCGRGSAARVGDEPRLDAAIDAALLLVAVVVRAGDRIGLVAVDDQPRVQLAVSSDRQAPRRVALLTADLDARLVETNSAAVIGAVDRLTGRHALVVLFTALEQGIRSTTLATVAGLTRHHRVVVAAVADPELEQLATMGAHAGSADAYGMAAAELARGQRAELAAQLRRMGAVVVDAPPAEFAAAVSNSYLDLKAAGRL